MQWSEYRQYWPFSNHAERSCQSFGDKSPLLVEGSLDFTLQLPAGHSCEAQSRCPLEAAKTALITGINNILDNACGLKLQNYR